MCAFVKLALMIG